MPLLADAAEAKRLLRAKGWGQVGMTVLEIAQLQPCAPQRPATVFVSMFREAQVAIEVLTVNAPALGFPQR